MTAEMQAKQDMRKQQSKELFDVMDAILQEHYIEFSCEGQALSVTQRDFMKDLKPVAEQIKQRIAEAVIAEDTPESVTEQCRVGISDDNMHAYAMILPAAFGGAKIGETDIREALQKAGVVYGIIDTVIADMAVAERAKIYKIAQGVEAVNGENGSVIEHFEREKKATFAKDDEEKVDYKNLNIIQKIRQGEKVCTIIPETTGTDGMTVLGNVLKARPGTPAFLPIGKNTELNEAQTDLIAKCDGQVLFAKQAFQVEPMLTIKGDVDCTVGNIDAIGTVNISGNVLEGFTVRASGDINVRGTVEGATLYAGKNINISTGVKGTGNSSINAKGQVKCKYIENCTVKAGGIVTANMIINSTIESDEAVEAKNGRGVIIGGSICARERISAKIIGNESNRRITLCVGIAPNYKAQHSALEKRLAEVRNCIEENQKNEQYLQNHKEMLDEQHHNLLSDIRLKLNLDRMQMKKMEKQIEKLEVEQNPQGSFIESTKLYPPANINIGSISRMIDETQDMCRIYLQDGEINIGLKS